MSNSAGCVRRAMLGQTLAARVVQGGPLSWLEAVELIAQLARGLDAAHRYENADGVREPIVHRDLKPENLFIVARRDGAVRLKILDFGIAKVLSESTALSRDVRGTPLFMAFEQLTGNEPSPRTDVWALGLITYYVLTGHHYWRSAPASRRELDALYAEILTLPLSLPSARVREDGIDVRPARRVRHVVTRVCRSRPEPTLRIGGARRRCSPEPWRFSSRARSLSYGARPAAARVAVEPCPGHGGRGRATSSSESASRLQRRVAGRANTARRARRRGVSAGVGAAMVRLSPARLVVDDEPRTAAPRDGPGHSVRGRRGASGWWCVEPTGRTWGVREQAAARRRTGRRLAEAAGRRQKEELRGSRGDGENASSSRAAASFATGGAARHQRSCRAPRREREHWADRPRAAAPLRQGPGPVG